MSQNHGSPETPQELPAPLQPHFDLANRIMASYVAALELAAEYEKRAGDFEEESRLDPVSGLLNRRALEDGFAHLQAAGQRRSGDESSMAIIDIDDFTGINDRLGHDGGDKMFRQVGDTIKANVRGDDIVGRLGNGDEIALILHGASMHQGAEVAEKVRAAVAEKTGVTLSLGVTKIVPQETFEDAYRRGDAALYAAKNLGRNVTVTIDPATDSIQQVTAIVPEAGDSAVPASPAV